MVWVKLEMLDELNAISLFHAVGFALEVFKNSTVGRHVPLWHQRLDVRLDLRGRSR